MLSSLKLSDWRVWQLGRCHPVLIFKIIGVRVTKYSEYNVCTLQCLLDTECCTRCQCNDLRLKSVVQAKIRIRNRKYAKKFYKKAGHFFQNDKISIVFHWLLSNCATFLDISFVRYIVCQWLNKIKQNLLRLFLP